MKFACYSDKNIRCYIPEEDVIGIDHETETKYNKNSKTEYIKGVLRLQTRYGIFTMGFAGDDEQELELYLNNFISKFQNKQRNVISESNLGEYC